MTQPNRTAPQYLIWSNQHAMWWRPAEAGYTQFIEEAGRYTEEWARELVESATVGGELTHQRVDPISGARYESLDEYAVLAPECRVTS